MRWIRFYSVAAVLSLIFLAGVALGAWLGSPVNLVMQPTTACAPPI